MSLEHMRDELQETIKTTGWIAQHRNLLQTEIQFFRTVPPLGKSGSTAKICIATSGERALQGVNELYEAYLSRIGELVMAVEKLEGKYERDRT